MNEDINKLRISRIDMGYISALRAGEHNHVPQYEYHVSNSPTVIPKETAAGFISMIEDYEDIKISAEIMTGHMIDHDLDILQLNTSLDVQNIKDHINLIIIRFPNPDSETLFKLTWL